MDVRDERADIDVSREEAVDNEVSEEEEEELEDEERADNGVDTVEAGRSNDTFCGRGAVSVSESVLFCKRLCGRVPNSDCCSGVR